MSRNLRQMFRSVAWVTAGTYVNSALALARGVIFARILGPQSYGIWAFLSTVQGLSINVDLGVTQVVARDMPGLVGRGEIRGAHALASLARRWTPAVCFVAGVVLAFLWPVFSWPAATGWGVLVPLLLLSMGAFAAAQAVERGALAFARLTALTTVAGLVGLVSGVGASRLFGVSGLVASQAAVYGSAALIGWAMRRETAPFEDLKRELRRSVLAGWPLLLPSIALSVFVSVDMLVAAWGLSASSVGLYGVALLGSSMAAGVIAGSVGTVVGQHLLKDTALSESGMPGSKMVWGPASALAAVLAPACAVAALLVPVVLRAVLPGYSAAVAPAVVLMAAAYYLQSQFGFSTTFVAARRPLATLPLFIVLIVANVVVDVVLLRAGWEMLGIATGSLIVNLCFVAAHEALVARLLGGGRRQLAQAVCTVAAGALPVGSALLVLGFPSLAAPVAVVGIAGWIGLLVVTAQWLGHKFPIRVAGGNR